MRAAAAMLMLMRGGEVSRAEEATTAATPKCAALGPNIEFHSCADEAVDADELLFALARVAL